MGAPAELGGGFRENGISGGGSEGRDRLGKPSVRLSPGNDQPARLGFDPLCNPIQEALVGARAARGDGRERRITPALQRKRIGGDDVSVDRNRGERLPPGDVEMYGAGPRVADRAGVGTAAD